MRAPDGHGLRRLVRYVLVVAMAWSLAMLVGFAWWGGEALPARIAAVGAALAAATAATFVVNHGLRFLRWHLMLRTEGHFVPVARSLSIFLAGLALLPTPAKAGVASRSVLLLAEGVPVRVSLAAYFAERLLDLVGLVILAALVLATLWPGNAWAVAAVAGAAGMLLVRAAPALLQRVRASIGRSSRAARAIEWVAACFHDAADMMAGWRLPAFVALGMAANALSGLLLWAVLRETARPVGAADAVGVLAVSHLSGSITLLPGGLGTFDLAMLAQLAALGVSHLDALVALALVRIATLWGSVLAGLPLLWLGMRRGWAAGTAS